MKSHFRLNPLRLMLASLAGMMAMTLVTDTRRAYCDEPPSPKPVPQSNVPVAAATAGQPLPGLRIIISLQSKKTVFLPAEPIVLKVTVKNISAQRVELTDMGGDVSKGLDWNVVVLDAAGRVMPHTLYGTGPTDRNMVSGSLNSHILQPNDEEHLTLIANRMADMTLYGRYDITVKRIILNFTQSVSPEATSNTVEVSVDEPLAISDSNTLTQHGPAKIRH